MSETRQPRDQEEEQLEQAKLIAELDETMAGLLQPLAPSKPLLAQLLASIERPPMRYAPFYSRIAELFDLSEDAVIAQCARLAAPDAWRFAGLPGIRHVPVAGGPRVQGAEVMFARFAPGLRFPRHKHTGPERVLVLEGSYVDSDGQKHGTGELHVWETGTSHGFRISSDEPCIVAAVAHGHTFEALPLRLLVRAFGR
jgi:quercetin dioxygenase-like cupin family protein